MVNHLVFRYHKTKFSLRSKPPRNFLLPSSHPPLRLSLLSIYLLWFIFWCFTTTKLNFLRGRKPTRNIEKHQGNICWWSTVKHESSRLNHKENRIYLTTNPQGPSKPYAHHVLNSQPQPLHSYFLG
jgi:hypothetical protein